MMLDICFKILSQNKNMGGIDETRSTNAAFCDQLWDGCIKVLFTILYNLCVFKNFHNKCLK